MMIKYAKLLAKEILNGNLGVLKNLKFYRRWKASLSSNSMADEHPCLTFEAVDILKNSITDQSKVFEYGGGGSTLFFVNRANEVVTVEHNEKWYSLLCEKIQTKNWHGVLIQPVWRQNDLDPSNPDDYSTWERDSTYHDYVKYVDRYPDEYFDIIMIDGRSRPSCIKHSLPKLKKGGLLVVDDIYRDYYLVHFKKVMSEHYKKLCSDRGPVPYYDFFAQTGVWRKLN